MTFQTQLTTPVNQILTRGAMRLSIVAAALLLQACASPSPTFDANFGKSVTAARLAQTRNPQASITNQGKPANGMDARASREAIDRYYDSFSTPPPPVNIFNIGPGTGGAN